jgi:hypothetical protein
MTSTLKLRSKAICLKMLSQRVVFPAAEPPATPITIFWELYSVKLFFRPLMKSMPLDIMAVFYPFAGYIRNLAKKGIFHD